VSTRHVSTNKGQASNNEYDQLIKFMQQMDAAEFLNAGNLDSLMVESTPTQLMDRIENSLNDEVT
jgi:hypothetical protein